MSYNPIQPKISKSGSLIITILIVSLGLVWTGRSSLTDRIITLRYFLFVLTGLAAFLTPYLLFPDRNASVIQLGNYSGTAIRQYLFGKIVRMAWPVFLLIGVMLFGDLQTPSDFLLEKCVYFVSSFSLFSGILFISVRRYVMSGPSSQFWKESEKGKKMRVTLSNLFKYPVDPGTFPSLVNTVVVFLLGSVSLVIGSYLGQVFSLYAEAGFFLIILLMGSVFHFWQADNLVKNFYSSNAFFREFFRVTLVGEEVTSKREVEQLWWVPARLKMHVWQFLLQLDRKIPAGRAVAVGHLVVWFTAYQRPEPQFLVIIWILFALFHQFFTIMTIQKEMAPPWLLRWIDRNSVWFASRFWMQLRWIVPLVLSMNLQYFLFGVPDYYDQAIILFLFLISALFTSLMGTIKLRRDFKI